ncbi:AraC family transcriptional regulator [Virgisporangium aliadipatigenens]|uniref:AraC family transcriptional regulator n=1 Tax=Virgisporangium aliadipatigenens TaxID=741659 RepID=A0A8J4DR88_9ACTN|nr:helix-turn-helix domain-containing protein [Virgisporangium aliadipatigenens]GIJ47394.1 AraC family transcriptional regulator [Virgisporangium aliadipatigenens]
MTTAGEPHRGADSGAPARDDGLVRRAGSVPGLTWSLARRAPDPRLGGLVAAIYGYTEQSAGPVLRRQLPFGGNPVILGLGPPIDVDGAPQRSFVAGLADRATFTRFSGAQRGVEIRLTPQGVHTLFGVPPGEFANAVVTPPWLAALADRVAECGWAEALDLVEATLLRRAGDGPTPDTAVTWAWNALRRSGGRTPVAALANEIGWSHRHFAARFRAGIGLAPKTAARVVRLERAAGRLSRGESAAVVAAATGYVDQSHLTREFRALGGCTPGRFLAERDAEQVSFVQDGQAAAA